MIRIGLYSALALCTLACTHGAAPTQIQATTTRTETELRTFTGITRRIEFKHARTAELVRLEIQHITTGRRILGETAVRVDEAGQWLLYNLADNKITARFKPANAQADEACKSAPNPQHKTVFFADFADDGAKWRANITRIYELPKLMPGVATESEPAVDLVACAFNIK